MRTIAGVSTSGGVILSVVRRILVLLAIASAFLELSASSAGGLSAPGTMAASLDRALHAWAGFPVDRSPRPIVPLQGYVLNPDDGFTDQATKDAFDNGTIRPFASWPAAPASSMGYRIVAAAEAFATLTTPTSGFVGDPPPLQTTGVQLGSGLFLTDRGWQLLPAWLFSFSGVQNPAKVLAVAPSAIYSAPVDRHGYSPSQLGVTLSRGGRRITANIAGWPPGTGPCTADYAISVKESKQAVAVGLITHFHAPSGRVVCATVASLRHASALLTQPVGSRVVVDAATDGAGSATTGPGA